jgi:1,4-dihydroxy-2-naphthoyl-CoA hydrolase
MDGDQIPDHAEMFNAVLGGHNRAMGLRFTKASADEVIGVITIGEQHLQPYGLVHGGVYCGMVETVSSAGAAIGAMAAGLTTVGLENSTTFLRAARSGTLTARGVPLSRGRRSQVWQVDIRDDQDRLVASGRVRMLNLEAGAQAGGVTVAVDPNA